MADPTPPTDFDALRLLTAEQLVQLGCRRWDENGLVLFPLAWFDSIPEGFMVRSIMGREVPFSRSLSRDRRYGMLAFGIVACPADFAPTASDDNGPGYPPGWPSCAAGCGLPAMDGHATCGQVNCNEAAHRGRR